MSVKKQLLLAFSLWFFLTALSVLINARNATESK
jgi:hypothetical protein